MNLGVPQFPAPGSAQVAGSRNKVALQPGRSLMDWIRLTNSGRDMTGTGGRVIKVTPDELARHNKPGDYWMALRGRVYNVSAYMDFHPGGEDELVRGTGVDATQLFDEVHRWVNAESMLAKCFVGFLDGDATPKRGKAAAKSRQSLSVNGDSSLLPPPPSPQKPPPTFSAPPPTFTAPPLKFTAPTPPPKLQTPTRSAPEEVSVLSVPSFSAPGSQTGLPQPSVQVTLTGPASNTPSVPRYDWMQNDSTLTLVVYTKYKKLRSEDVIIEKKGRHLKVTIMLAEHYFMVNVELQDDVQNDYSVKVHSSGKCEVILSKLVQGCQWQKVALPSEGDKTFKEHQERTGSQLSCGLLSRVDVTHDCRLLTFALPDGVHMSVPLCYHVRATADVMGMEVSRFYTTVPASMIHSEADEQSGKRLHLLIKIYPDGALTPVIDKLAIGDVLQLSTYEGTFVEQRLIDCTRLVMIAAGTGITPMAGLIVAATRKHASKDRRIQLLFFNKQEKDIIWRDELDVLHQEHGVEVSYILSQPHSEWSGERGRVRQDLLEEVISSPDSEHNVLLCVCGPAAFTEETLRLVNLLGYTDEMIHAFVG